MKYNINDTVIVRLTEHGKKVYEEWHIKNRISYIKPFTGEIRFQLQELMNIFGNSMFNGAQRVFVDNEIYLYDNLSKPSIVPPIDK